jgi:hypothetical protein
MLFSGTKENRALADATISRLRAEARDGEHQGERVQDWRILRLCGDAWV